jgi:hypothetical protein
VSIGSVPTPAAWYEDPWDPSRYRYWDGYRWTGDVAEPFHPLLEFIPDPFGSAEAVKAIGTVAAPLLAGFSVTISVLVVQNSTNVRWPTETLAALSASVVVLIMAVQCGFWAISYYNTFSAALDMWPDKDDDLRREGVERSLADHLRRYRTWASALRLMYDLGLLLLIAGFGMGLLPSGKHVSKPRLIPSGIAAIGFVIEISWVVVAAVTAFREWRSSRGVAQVQ